MEKTPYVSIIILNYNAGNFLIDCVSSILKSNFRNFQVIVVDNKSSDNSHIICKDKFKEIELIENEENLGYCGGNNVGLKVAKGEFVIILNPDTVVEPDWIDELISAQKKFGDGFYQPKILSMTDKKILLSTGNETQIFGFGFSRSKGKIDNGQFEKIENVGCASGTCIFTSMKIFKKIGLFDPFLFAYHDDIELCWRGLLQNIKSYYVPKSIIYHPLEGYSFKWSKLKYFLLERNRKYCILTLYTRNSMIKLLPHLLVIDIGVLLFYMKKGMLKEKIKADFNIIKNIKKINKKYYKNQNNRILSDNQIIKLFKDEIEVPKWVSSKESNQSFNFVLKKLAKICRKII